MNNSADDSPTIKLIATCPKCDEPLPVADDLDEKTDLAALCPKCSGKTAQEQTNERILDPDVPALYEIKHRIEECQNGKAFLVRDTSLDTNLIIRFVTTGVARLTGGLPIEKVAQLLVQETHPHLSTVYDWRTDTKSKYLIVDAPTEKTLESLIKDEGFLDLPRAIEIFIQVCEGLEELHKMGVIHGHLRPRTVGIVEQDNKIDIVKLTNFSITNTLSNNIEQPLKISRNYTCNDAFYMSPEELRGECPTVSGDIYNLGCVFFHSITGKPVYRARTVQEVKDQHLDPAPAKFRRRYEIPNNVELVILRMLEFDPRKRYKSVKSIRKDFERLRSDKEPLLEDRWKTMLSYFGQ
ncbi:MAG: serine/threonine protein kinase [Candidatus Obscuribacterales bacterium]|nr:serine/threonine protein kinase [Candidatus Obscuribacterales bacterium]